ncbi:hypothetical protein P5G51_005560 [Virgibacillus sp. 179-BFC.A HS]|uniref:Transposase n=1 Tax=Tigheibacillus jepli TaxID=3035914 RepID=A0ABU5CHC3_9BACI|nr:hypothetical protein [Virgibacillus sp. 179-BFC.A HS]MDY0404935.1 hypothetical protein [Virgibacillus sp. 179-BFC.A HS]
MFIRETITKNKMTNKSYKKHVLVESYRTENGPRQRVVMQLGTLTLPKSEWKKLAAALEGPGRPSHPVRRGKRNC